MKMDKTHDNGMCLACGGKVDADGYAEGGEVEEPSGENEMGPLNPEEQGDESSQYEQNRKMRHAALKSALKGK